MKNNYESFITPYNTTDDTELILSIDELMESLKIGRNSAYKLLKTGKIKAFRVGTTWKIPKESLKQYIHEQSGLSSF